MSWALPFFFIKLIAYLRGVIEMAGSAWQMTGRVFVVSSLLYLISIVVGRRSILLGWLRFQ